jgi:hypothetical protein
MHGVPAPVPHTRPLRVTASGAELIRAGSRQAKLQVPGSAQALVDYRLSGRGIDSKTVLVHVPHYLAVTPHAASAVALLERVSLVSALRFDLTRLATAAEQTDREIARQVEGSEELGEMVRDLERNYDERGTSTPLALPGEPLPDAEAIAAELEAFLAEQNRGDSAEF